MVNVQRFRQQAVPFAKKVVNELREEEVPFMAGSIAYQAFVSLIPLLLLAFFAVSLVGDEALAQQVVDFTREFLPEQAATLLGESIEGETGSVGASFIGLVTLVWGTLKIFRGLDTAFSEIYDTSTRNSLIDQVVDGLVMLAAIGGAILAAGAAVTVVSLLSLPGDGVILPLVLIGVLVLAFYPMYARFPDMPLSRREILPGVAVAALGWAALQVLFQVYVGFASQSESTGVFGAIILLLTWLYFGGLVLLLGAVVNAVIAGRRGKTPIGRDGAAEEDTEDRQTAEERSGDLSERLHVERDRRRRAERERDRLHRELQRLREQGDPSLPELRKRNRRLRQRLRWERRPFPVRVVWRLLGRTPPDPPVDATTNTADRPPSTVDADSADRPSPQTTADGTADRADRDQHGVGTRVR